MTFHCPWLENQKPFKYQRADLKITKWFQTFLNCDWSNACHCVLYALQLRSLGFPKKVFIFVGQTTEKIEPPGKKVRLRRDHRAFLSLRRCTTAEHRWLGVTDFDICDGANTSIASVEDLCSVRLVSLAKSSWVTGFHEIHWTMIGDQLTIVAVDFA